MELDDKTARIIAKVEKLLTLANDKGATEAEAAAASEAAMSLLEAYNLSIDVIDAKKAIRSDAYLGGGLYKWQRELWFAVADLNFCMYFYVRGMKKGSQYQHRLVGKKENVTVTRMMAEYLQQTVERLAREKCNGDGKLFFTREMIAYREGIADRLWSRLWKLRRDRIAEEQRKQEEAAKNSPRGDGSSLVLKELVESERAANHDFLHGEGSWAAMQGRIAAAEERARKQAEAYEAWKKANPEEAARREAEEKLEREKNQRRQGRFRGKVDDKEKRRRSSYYNEGWDKGGDISLNDQIDVSKTKKIQG